MNESDLSSATHSSEDLEKDKNNVVSAFNESDMIEIVIDVNPTQKQDISTNNRDSTTKNAQTCTPKSCRESCCEKVKSFYCGKSASYFSCVLMYGCFPGLIILISFAIISGIVWGVVGGSTGMIVGIVFLCMSIVIPIIFINSAALYAYCYPSNNIGSLGYCCFCCK